jgi:hypothetical protein
MKVWRRVHVVVYPRLLTMLSAKIVLFVKSYIFFSVVSVNSVAKFCV